LARPSRLTPLTGAAGIGLAYEPATSDHNGLFSSGTLGRYSKVLDSVLEKRLEGRR